jgi:hypothetical protein
MLAGCGYLLYKGAMKDPHQTTMLGKFAADITGSADVCTCVSKEKFGQVAALQFLLPQEVPFIVLKSGKEEHVFTDRAYISFKGESASTTRRLVGRFSYRSNMISRVKYETAGLGMTDRDVELKFIIGDALVSIDIWKKEAPTAILYFKILSAISSAQKKNESLLQLAKDSRPLHFDDVSQSIAWAETISNRYIVDNYGYIFAQFLQQ